MTTRARLTVYAAFASALAMMGLSPLLEPAGWLVPAGGLIIVIALSGASLRRLATPRPLVVTAQLLIVLYLLLFGSVHGSFAYGLLPGPAAIRALNDLLLAAGDGIREYAIPAPATAGLRLVLVAAVALIALLVDALAVTYRRAALAGLPLLALYSVGTGLIGDETVVWLWFVLAAAGYLMLLFAEGRDRLSRWGRVFRGAGNTDARGGGGTLSTGGHQIGLLALVAALLLPAFAPSLNVSLVDGGIGNGGSGGKGNGSINALNPVVSLADGLRSPQNQELIRYHGSDPELRTAYLRITALDEFNGVEWKPGSQAAQAVPNLLPYPTDLAGGVDVQSMQTAITVSDKLSSQWLPAPYALVQENAAGNWRYEPDSRSIIGDRGQQATGLSYTVSSLNIRPTAEQLRVAGTPPRDLFDHYTALPAGLPAVVHDTALRVTSGKGTAYDKAVALQDWFAQNGGFTYSPSVDPGTGSAAIEHFLQTKQGFCVHFAATMAAMARTLGIPARVAVGFAPGRDLGDGTYEVGTKDYHAWPELYFAGAGWLRFEPTPSRGTPPEWAGAKPAPKPSASAAQPSASASAQGGAAPAASSSCSGVLRKQGGCPDQLQADATPQPKQAPWLTPQVLALLSATGLLVVLLLAPMVWRARLRRRRLGEGRRRAGAPDTAAPGGGLTEAQVLAAWAELIDTAWDLGIAPDEERSPRHTVDRISEQGELKSDARAAVGRVALATERVLYAREAGHAAPLGTDVRIVRDGLRASAGRRRRLRAVLLPPSTARVVWRVADRVMAVRLRGRALRQRVTTALGAPVRALGARLARPAKDDGQD
ncbi:DUF3488 and transglutaminase-like domain-containing protein [Kitasatospora nipponensis]|uniref:DUF3488 and transglutaminase-like domain-containing protein n=1 Tax=Kitasatospora nipponensis TaxID=258049 RepID=A0ABN1X1G0_9ACTN